MSSNQFDQEILQLTNNERTSRGLDPLQMDDRLDRAANLHTDEMVRADKMDHQLPGEAKLGDRVTATGYDWNYAKENIAAGYTTPEDVVAGWMSSTTGHREAILDPEFTHIGIGYESAPDNRPYNQGNTEGKDYDTYWTQVFATGDDSSDNQNGTQDNTGNNDSNLERELDSNTEIASSELDSNSNTEIDPSSDENIDLSTNLETDGDSNSNNGDNDNLSSQPDLTASNSDNDNLSSQPDLTASNNERDIFDRELLQLVNNERTSRGLDPLLIDEQLDQAADLHTNEMIQADRMDHQLPGEARLGDRVTATGYEWSYVSENIAAGQLTPEEVMYGEYGWMNSNDGHREAILDPEFTHIGIGYGSDPDDNDSYNDQDTYWTQVFATEL